MRTVTIRQLRALAAVARTGSVTAAARALSVTPPAVTQQVQLLERIAGLPVVERSGQTMRATAAGAEFLAAHERIEAALADCAAALAALKGEETGAVSVGVVSTAKYFAPLALGAFARAHPQIELKLVVGNRAEIVAGLADLSLDVAVMGRPPEGLDVSAEAIGDHPHIVIAAPDHRLVGRAAIPAALLAEESFLAREEGSGTRALTEQLFVAMGRRPRIALVIGSNETIKQAVIGGLGISVISAHTVGAEIADGRLAVLDVVGLPIMRQWYVLTMRGKRLLPAAGRLHAFLLREAERFLPAVGPAPGTPAPRLAPSAE